VIPGDLPIRLRGHAYLLADSSPRRPTGDGVLLVGDAVGLADPHSGEGIRPAVESGLLAARAILSADGRYGRERFVDYRQSLRDRFGWGTSPRSASLTAAVPGWLVRPLARTALGSRSFTRHVVLDRWFLARTRRPLDVSFAYRSVRTQPDLARRGEPR
jgi:hypothetical protein